jgi:hypothetical protein
MEQRVAVLQPQFVACMSPNLDWKFTPKEEKAIASCMRQSLWWAFNQVIIQITAEQAGVGLSRLEGNGS